MLRTNVRRKTNPFLLLPWTGLGCVCLILLFGEVAATAAESHVHTDVLNYDPVVKDAYQHFYNLDYDGALSRFEQVQRSHPANSMATAYVLNCVLFRELYRLDLLDTTFYANDGFLTGKHTVIEDPKVRDQITSLAAKVIDQANEELKTNSDDVHALYARGWARSLKAAYLAMVERAFATGLHLAVQARGDHEHVLQKDPDYVDARMVPGVYQYVMGSLPFGFKILVGFTGMGGSKSKGMELLRDSAAQGVITSIESRTCIALFLRREGEYKPAIAIIRSQAKQYPRNFLFALEEANLLKDDGEGPAAIAAYRRILTEAKVPGHYPNADMELAWFGLGDSLRGQNKNAEAVVAYEHAAAEPTVSPELERRCLLSAGQVYDLMKDRNKAQDAYQAVVAAGPDTTQAELARKYLRSAYTR